MGFLRLSPTLLREHAASWKDFPEASDCFCALTHAGAGMAGRFLPTQRRGEETWVLVSALGLVGHRGVRQEQRWNLRVQSVRDMQLGLRRDTLSDTRGAHHLPVPSGGGT